MTDIKKLFSWKDVERIILANKKQWEHCARRIVVYDDLLEISLKSPEDSAFMKEVLAELFDGNYKEKEDKIKLEFGNDLLIDYSGEEETKNENHIPLFRKILYQDTAYNLELSDESLGNVPIIAFHSYKGGVGRTLALLAFAKAWTEKQPEEKRKILIVDSDIEAPGLTWLQNEMQEQHYSYLDLLEEIQNREVEDNIDGIVSQIKKSTISVTTAKEAVAQYFLPVYRYEEQLLDIYSKPENIVTAASRQYVITETLSQIGGKLGVSMILVDLRAGISEYSSPYLFDVRVKKYLISSTSSQSIDGLLIMLKYLMKGLGMCKDKIMPEVFLTMVQDTLDKQEKQGILEKIEQLFLSDSSESVTAEGLITELPFLTELVHLSSLEQIFRVLEPSSFLGELRKVVENSFTQEYSGDDIEKKRKAVIKNIHEFAVRQVTAEGNAQINVLMTQSIGNLKKKYENEIPCTLIMGAKGSGKTFLYRQMLKNLTWQQFCASLANRKTKAEQIFFVPVLASKNANSFFDLLKNCVDNTNQKVSGSNISKTVWLDNEEKITGYLETEHKLQEWKVIWEKLLVQTVNSGFQSFDELNAILEGTGKQVVFLIDGLEEIFQSTINNTSQQLAIGALCQDVIRNLMARYSNLGAVIFVRKDVVRDSIKVNFEQFSQIYSSVELNWSKNEALRLALWLVKEAQPDFYTESVPIESATPEVIEKQLQRLWGLKLGKASSNEAYASKWILAALSDFNGQLQARDIVRFLQFATEKAGSLYKDRYIMPAEIRQAVPKCSEKKIFEIKQEIGALSPILQKMEEASANDKKLPFSSQTFHLTVDEERLMIQQGYLIIEEGNYYLPEILRHSLGFIYKKGARPKVLSLRGNA